MAKAHAAPGLRGSEKVDVTTHALEKLRERLPPGSHFLSMPDNDIRLRVEESWKTAVRTGIVEEWWERVEGRVVLNHVIDFEDFFEAELVGLFRDDQRHPGKPVLITVLTRDMAESNKVANKWARSADKIDSKELLTTPMKGALAAVTVPPKKPAVVPAPPPVPTPQVVQQPAAIATPAPDMESLRKMVVTYSHPETGDAFFEFVSKGRVQDLVNHLIEKGVDETSIQFWVKAEAKLKKTVTVDF